MCGIVGVVGDITGREEKLFKELLVVDSIRGMDSTGVASVNRSKEVKIAKTIGDPFQLMETHNFLEIMRQKNHVLIGHNRAATTGKVIRKNAHPFEMDGLVGVHNGTLRNKHVLEDSHKFDTDSEALYHNIDLKGLSEGIEKVDGAYSLVWYDKDEDTINFLRNEERPMNLLFSENRKVLFFASEAWMLTAILSRDSYKFGTIEKLPEDQHFSLQIPDNKEFEKAKVRQVKPTPFQRKVYVTEKKTTTPITTSTTGGGVSYPNAQEYLNKFRLNPLAGSKKEPKRGTLFEGFAAGWGISSGNVYIFFRVNEFPGEIFRTYVKTVDEAEALVSKHYTGTVTSMTYENGSWIYKANPDLLIPKEMPAVINIQDYKKEDTKPDHQGYAINKEQFETRYSSCAWCSSPVTFEENWLAHTANDCLCESCTEVPEVKEYLPQLRSMC